MPHIDIKCFPRELNDQQKAELAAEITDVIIRHLNSKESSISIALQQIPPGIVEVCLGCRNCSQNGNIN